VHAGALNAWAKRLSKTELLLRMRRKSREFHTMLYAGADRKRDTGAASLQLVGKDCSIKNDARAYCNRWEISRAKKEVAQELFGSSYFSTSGLGRGLRYAFRASVPVTVADRCRRHSH
jgi:hypothetical protein